VTGHLSRNSLVYSHTAYRFGKISKSAGTNAKNLHLPFSMCAFVKVCHMSMREEYQTKAAEYHARATGECNPMTRMYFQTLANEYTRLAEQAEGNAQLDLTYERRRGASI